MINRRAVAALSVAAASAAGAPSALAAAPTASPRADAYFMVMCLAPGATEPASFERVDARSLEPGNKDEQVAAYGQHHAGWTCWLEPGPQARR
jgi:hypothetical protein